MKKKHHTPTHISKAVCVRMCACVCDCCALFSLVNNKHIHAYNVCGRDNMRGRFQCMCVHVCLHMSVCVMLASVVLFGVVLGGTAER